MSIPSTSGTAERVREPAPRVIASRPSLADVQKSFDTSVGAQLLRAVASERLEVAAFGSSI